MNDVDFENPNIQKLKDIVKEKEGSSLEWGTESVLSRETEVPDIIFDRGDVGKEPMIRVLGRTPDEVVGKVLETTRAEDVQVRLAEVDGEDGVWLGREVGDAG